MPVKWGSEFLVNTTTKGWQTSAAVTALRDGRFVVAWEDTSNSGGDSSSSGIRAQIFNADGGHSGSEFLVNTTTASLQYQPSITELANGRFAVTWTDLSKSGADTSGAAVRGQVFDAGGSKSGGEFLANTTTLGFQDISVMTTLTSDRFVVAWSDASATGGDTSSWAVRAQIFNPTGGKFGGEILVNSATLGEQSGPSLTALTGGGFVVTWRDAPGGIDAIGDIRAQIFAAGGGKSGGEFLVNTVTGGNQYDPTVAALANGRFVVAWTDSAGTGGDTSGDAIRAQIYDAGGAKSGDPFLVNATTAGDQNEQVIAVLNDGRFVVAWFDLSKSGGDKEKGAIRAQVFNDDGSKSGGEFLVNTTTADTQALPTIATLADGRFVIAWSDYSHAGADKSEAAIRGQIFDPREGPVTLVGTALGEDFVGTRFKDAINGSAGDDILDSGAGSDTITGGVGADRFLFSTALKKKFGSDTVTDFSVADDTILLDNAVFTKLTKAGALKGRYFFEGKKAHDGNDRIIYDDQSGKLSYDKNGDHKGGAAKVAILGEGLELSAADFLVV